jgi:hypothetical protein
VEEPEEEMEELSPDGSYQPEEGVFLIVEENQNDQENQVL